MLLESINSPADLKKLKPEQLPGTADVRQFLLKPYPQPAVIWAQTWERSS
jgi:deoxyxylulose-5-phosphate synthase